MPSSNQSCIAFHDHQRIAQGPLVEVVRASKELVDAGADEPLLLDEQDSRPIEVDFRGTVDEVLARLSSDATAPVTANKGPGRPKLGVVPREITLLPRHWDWLGQQPGGASATLRQLVEQALRHGGARERARRAVESVDRFMRVMAGDAPGYEEASRAFYRGDRMRFERLIQAWPHDVQTHLRQLAAVAWDEQADAATPS